MERVWRICDEPSREERHAKLNQNVQSELEGKEAVCYISPSKLKAREHKNNEKFPKLHFGIRDMSPGVHVLFVRSTCDGTTLRP